MVAPSGPLGPEQQELVKLIGRELLKILPQGWQRCRAEYRAAGRHVEADISVTDAAASTRPVQPPPEVVRLFGQLRTTTYQPGRGTWLSAVYTLEAPAAFNVDFGVDNEPRWRRQPPPLGFQDELRFFPRNDEWIPDWWRQRAGMRPAPVAGRQSSIETPAVGLPAQASPTGPIRTPKVHDGLDQSGRPIIRRQPLALAERERVLNYLDSAPVVLAARSYDTDPFAPNEPPSVPLNFRTDGVWVWPGAVTHYLRNHQIPPDPELLAHIRGRGFTVPEVDDARKELAVSTVTGENG